MHANIAASDSASATRATITARRWRGVMHAGNEFKEAVAITTEADELEYVPESAEESVDEE
jgi:hypothetical protein